MATRERYWQARGQVNGERVAWYGSSLPALYQAVQRGLAEQEATLRQFGPVNKHYIYYWLDSETVRDPEVQALLTQHKLKPPDADAEPGWYVIATGHNTDLYASAKPHFIGTLADATQQFIDRMVVAEKGPDYTDPFSDLDTLPLHRMKTVLRVEGERRANDYIRRGWYLLALDTQGTEDDQGYVESRTTIYVLGHPEADAS